jgi:dolichol-phosphate mannosyltransferase
MRTLVVLPTYNEIPNIELMLRTLREVVPECHILVVDDGSPDGTAARARAVGAELDEVTVLERSAKGGLGGAYRTGFTWGLEHDFDHFVEIDSDFSHDPRALPALLVAAEEYEVVIGSRYIKGGHIPNWARSRRLLSRGGNQYAEIVLKIDFQTVTADGYGFQIEMTFRARSHGATIIEVPISFKDRELGESKMSKAIVIEALGLVTQWAIEKQLRRLRTLNPIHKN